MVLLIDLGNHSLNVAVYQNRICVVKFRLYADKLKSEIEYQEALLSYLNYHKIDCQVIEGAILSSVVPSLTKRIQNAVSKVIGKECLVLDHHLKTSLALRMDNPSEVGSNLIATAVGALNDFPNEYLLIADLDSVFSLFCVSDKREYLGGILFPGINSSLSEMISSSALLSEVDLEKPKRMLGKNTKEAISIGILKGYPALIRSYSLKVEEEIKRPVKRLLTGKDSVLIKDEMKEEYLYQPNLCFDGLYDIYLKNTGKKEKENA